jgi:hypothetical protein
MKDITRIILMEKGGMQTLYKNKSRFIKDILVNLNTFENLTLTFMVAIIQQLVMISNNKIHHHS